MGPTRCGKTSTILKNIIFQILLAKKQGTKIGLSVVEPKGDVAQMVREGAELLDMPFVHVDPDREDSHIFNPMQGDIDDVAEATVAVLQTLFGKQEAFFRSVQELSSRNVTKLLKELHGDDIDLMDILHTLRDHTLLSRKVKELKAMGGSSDLISFFENELLGTMKDKYQQFVIGLRAQLENLIGNRHLKRIMTGRSSINIDEHYANGGIFAVNTSLGKLRKSGDAFGQFVIMHLQSGALRRPGTERTRIPHIMIVDELSRYINPDIEMFLSIAAEYRVAGMFAIQSLGQLEVEAGKISAKAMKQAIMGSCRNKIAFGGLSYEDAKAFSNEFGTKKVMVRQSTFKSRIVVPPILPDNYRDTEEEIPRYEPTFLMDGMPRFHFIHKLLQDGHPQEPGLARGEFLPRNWQAILARKEGENNKRIFRFKFKKKHKKHTKTTFQKEVIQAEESQASEFSESSHGFTFILNNENDLNDNSNEQDLSDKNAIDIQLDSIQEIEEISPATDTGITEKDGSELEQKQVKEETISFWGI